MSDFVEATREVYKVLSDLRDLLNVSDMRENGGLRGEAADVRRAWMRFEQALHQSVSVIRNPQPGQGLASLWLTVVLQRAALVDDAVANFPSGWLDVIIHEDDNLFWLVTSGWDSNNSVAKFCARSDTGLLSLLEPASTPMEQLQLLADAWSIAFQETVKGLDETAWQAALNSSGAWQEEKSSIARKTGEFLLQAIDGIEVAKEFLSNEFCDQILQYVRMPAGLVAPYLRQETASSLYDFVDRLKSQRPKVQNPNPNPKKVYSSPANYDRDKWIYDNVHLYDYQTLSKMLEKECLQKQWKALTSRNGLKVAADRFADSHDLKRRRFPDDRNLS